MVSTKVGAQIIMPYSRDRGPVIFTPQSPPSVGNEAGSHAALRLDSTMIQSLPFGFRKLAEDGRLSAPTVEVLCRLTLYAQDPWSLERLSNDDEALSTFEEACPALKSPTMTIEKLLCLTILVYCSLAFCTHWSDLNASPSLVVRRRVLESSLEEFGHVDDSTELSCLKWMWLVAIESWKEKDDCYAVNGLHMLARFRERYAETTWHDVERTLQLFMWDDKLSMLSLRRLWALQAPMTNNSQRPGPMWKTEGEAILIIR